MARRSTFAATIADKSFCPRPSARSLRKSRAAVVGEKIVMNSKIFSLLLLGVSMFAVQEVRAANPRSHRLHGIVQSVDGTAHSLTVQKSTKAKPLVILWNERTRFRDGKEPAKPESLQAGQAVSVSYRVWPGRLEASRVDIRRASSAGENGSAKGGASDLMKH